MWAYAQMDPSTLGCVPQERGKTPPTERLHRNSSHLKLYAYREFFDFAIGIDHMFLLCMEMNRNVEALHRVRLLTSLRTQRTAPTSRLFHGGLTSEPVSAGGMLVVHVDSAVGISEAANTHSVHFDGIPL